MTFKSKKDTYFKFLLISFSLLFISYPIYMVLLSDMDFSIFIKVLPVLAFTVLLYEVYFKTSFEISKGLLICKRIIVKEIIPIDRIHSITAHKTLIIGTHPATARTGLLLNYKTNKEIYITPENEDVFMERLLKFNPEIKIRTNGLVIN